MNVESVLGGYLTTALWAESANDYGDSFTCLGYTADNYAPETMNRMRDDVLRFVGAVEYAGIDLGGYSDAAIGHDLWLTRTRSGAGFWDGDYPDGAGERLTEIADNLGECWIVLGDDGLIYTI